MRATATAARTVAVQTSRESRPRAVLHVGKVVAEGRYARLSHPIRDGLQGGVSHIRAGPVAEDEEVARVAGPHEQGGDFPLLRRGEESSSLSLREPFKKSTTRSASSIVNRQSIATPSSSSNFRFMCKPPV